MKKNINFLIVGLGNIGIRHFESLINKKNNYTFYLVDPNIKIIKKKISNYIHSSKINFFESLNISRTSFDYIIVSTNSDIRKKILMELIKNFKFKFLLLEKIAFNHLKEYSNILKIIKKHDADFHINYVRNYMKCYLDLKNQINQKKTINLEVYGKNWNLASNTFHFLSLFSFFNENQNIKISSNSLSKPIKSKRKGFFDLRGFIEIITSRGDRLYVSDQNESLFMDCIIIKNDNNIFIINEDDNRIFKINSENNSCKSSRFNFLPQSKMTNKIIEKENYSLFNSTRLITNYKNEIKLLSFFKLCMKGKVSKMGSIPIT